MHENNKKFFNKLYDDMIINNVIKEVNRPLDRDTKIKFVDDFLDRISRIENDVGDYRNSLRILKEFYYKKYVINEEDIPLNYYKLQLKLDCDKGLGLLELNDYKKHEMARGVILNQKKSLDIWLDYFLSDDGKYYPYELKYWAFQGILGMGKYDNTKNAFMRRNRHTVGPFIEFNKELISVVIDNMQKYLNNEKIFDIKLYKLLSSGNFSKIYTYFYNNYKDRNIYKCNDGIWVKYNRYGDYEKLANSLMGMNTGWCTASVGVAQIQLEDGDMYIYYTKDRNGEYKIPRLAIRTKFDSIEEIRGISDNQNIESNMEKILEKKLDEFPDKNKYYKKLDDMSLMTKLYDKFKNKQDFSRDELIFLYEIYSKINCFGEEKDPRIDEIKRSRDNVADLMVIFNISRDEIATSYEDLISNSKKIKCYLGNLELDNEDIIFDNLFCVYGNAYFHGVKSGKCIPSIKYIIGNADFSSLEDASYLNNLEYVIGDAVFDLLLSAKGLDSLKYIGRDAGFDRLITLKGLSNLVIIDGDAEFMRLKTLENSKLKYIGGDAYFDSLEEKQELKNIKINGLVYLGNDFYKGRMI